MIINNITYNSNYLKFSGKKKEIYKQKQEIQNTPKKHSALSTLVLTTVGVLTSGLFGQQVYNSINNDYRVQSEQTDFDNKSDAMQYAKRKITKALNDSNYPHEYLVYVGEDNEILGEFDGNNSEVHGNLLFYDRLKKQLLGYKYTSLHGHPEHNGYSSPLSFNDFEILNNDESLNEIVAFNKNGEKSILRKKDNFKKLDNETIKSMLQDYRNKLIEESKINMPEKWNQVGKSIKNDFCNYTYTEEHVIIEYQQSLEGIKCIHNYWKNIAPKYNLEYKTNYSYL